MVESNISDIEAEKLRKDGRGVCVWSKNGKPDCVSLFSLSRDWRSSESQSSISAL